MTADTKVAVHRGGLHVEQGGADFHDGTLCAALSGCDHTHHFGQTHRGWWRCPRTGGLIVQSEGLDVTGTTTLRHEVTALQKLTATSGVSLLGREMCAKISQMSKRLTPRRLP